MGQLKKGRGAAGEGRRGGRPLHIGLAGALTYKVLYILLIHIKDRKDLFIINQCI